MLVLSRRQGQSIIVSDTIEINITETRGDQVRLGIKAPNNVKIFRKEIYEQVQEAMRSAAQSKPDTSKLSELQRLLNQKKSTPK